ncbi:hypothetical protein [Aequorivita antarctica]|uniref:Tetratricopeptide repeat protein n=1 Tax=Aequorivita antarctica TaxID=153266 RepID=A0A5C6YUW4_9FLAO|nr:hypothetical protein [Aequorivita antarctica]TXD71360.1 hypothetical protein ESU54_17090 [Aequorivita antarctica]
MLKNEPSIYILAETALVENNYIKGDFQKAKSLVEKLLPDLEKIAFNEEGISILILLSNIAKDMGEVLQAVEYGKAALKAALNPEIA